MKSGEAISVHFDNQIISEQNGAIMNNTTGRAHSSVIFYGVKRQGVLLVLLEM